MNTEYLVINPSASISSTVVTVKSGKGTLVDLIVGRDANFLEPVGNLTIYDSVSAGGIVMTRLRTQDGPERWRTFNLPFENGLTFEFETEYFGMGMMPVIYA